MAVTFEQATGARGRTWECKECHHLISEEDTVAYHLVDRILYGWCISCFERRTEKALAEAAA